MIAHRDERGPQDAVDYYSTPDSITGSGECYGAILIDGLIAAHPLRPEIIGQPTGGAMTLDNKPVVPLMFADGTPEGRW